MLQQKLYMCFGPGFPGQPCLSEAKETYFLQNGSKEEGALMLKQLKRTETQEKVDGHAFPSIMLAPPVLNS